LSFSPDGTLLATASLDMTALVWRLAGPGSGGRPGAALSAQELESRWSALASDDAAKAYRAIRALAASPRQAVPFLQRHLRPAPVADPKRLRASIADLDSDDFAVRDRAAQELEKLGGAAEPALRQALAGNPAPEVRRQLSELLTKAQDWTPSRLQSWRALEVLELVRTPATQTLLQTLAQGAPEARLTQGAKATLERLAKRSANTP
jgi:hypothetical protein